MVGLGYYGVDAGIVVDGAVNVKIGVARVIGEVVEFSIGALKISCDGGKNQEALWIELGNMWLCIE